MVGRVRITHFFGFELFFLKPEKMQEEGTFNHELLESIFHTSKKQFRNTYGKSNGTTATARCARTCCWEPSSTTGRV